MTNLIAIGCSFTSDKIIIRDKFLDIEKFRGYPVWPKILSEKLKMDVVNLGKIGTGNKYIFDQVMSLDGDDIGLVVCMWSGWDRENVGTDKTLKYMTDSQRYLNSVGYPYIFIQGVFTYNFYPRTSEVRKLIDSPYLDDLETANFIGWPIFLEIGGWCIEDKMEDIHRFSVHDQHPNTEGHKLIAKLLYDYYVKLYV